MEATPFLLCDREVAPVREVQRVLALEEGCGAVAVESGRMSKWTSSTRPRKPEMQSPEPSQS